MERDGHGVGAVVGVGVGALHYAGASTGDVNDIGHFSRITVAPIDDCRVGIVFAIVDKQAQERMAIGAGEIEQAPFVRHLVSGDHQYRRDVVDVNDGVIVGEAAILVDDAALDGVVAGAIHEDGARHTLAGARARAGIRAVADVKDAIVVEIVGIVEAGRSVDRAGINLTAESD